MDILKKFNIAKSSLKDKLDVIVQVFEASGVSESKYIGLDIKIPVNGNFSDFRKNIDDLDFIFTKCPFLQSKEETLCFKNVDIGSVWFSFAVVGTGVVIGSCLINNIAALIDKCIILRSHFLTIKKQMQDIERSKNEQKDKDELIQYLNKLYKIQVDNVIDELQQEIKYEINDGDERGRIEQCFEKLGRLIDKGLEIHAAIGSPKETKALFAPIEMKYLELGELVHAIEQKSDK